MIFRALKFAAACAFVSHFAYSDSHTAPYPHESTFTCKQTDPVITFYFRAKTLVSKDEDGNYSEPTDLEFGFTQDGTKPRWSTLDGAINFVLNKNQILVTDREGKTVGKVVCE
jgi:hypothetical protein